MKNWHSIHAKEIFIELDTSEKGLSGKEAETRLKEFGPNVLPQEKPYSKIRLFFSQLNSPMVYILLVIIGISVFLKHYSDTVFIVIVLLVNALVGFYQENKANKALSLLKKMVKIKARVWRGGYEKEIDSENLVEGDVIELQSGEKVPADCRLIEAENLKVNEASLTGESSPVLKKTAVKLPLKIPVPDRTNMVFMGTVVEDGIAKAVVVSTGPKTQFGQIVSLVKKTKERQTPLQKKLIKLTRFLTVIILIFIVLVAFLGYFSGQLFAEIFVVALAVAASAIPVGLLPAITVILAFGARRIFKRKGLVRKLVAIETIGASTVICTDKTGTLTEGKMQVSHVLTGKKELTQDGLNGLGKKWIGGKVESHITALKIAAMVSEAFVENPKEELEKWIIRGRATDTALLLSGMQVGLEKHEMEKQEPVIGRIHFKSDIKYSAALCQKPKGKQVLYVIGAPEKIIAFSSFIDEDGRKLKLTAKRIEALNQKIDSLTAKGLRVIATAHKTYDSHPKLSKKTWALKPQKIEKLVHNLTLVGFIALKDPLRKEAKTAITVTKKAGIKTVIITGDHKLTAKAIANEVGLGAADENIIEGKDLDAMDEAVLRERAKTVSIYARVSPRHKLLIIDALQKNGEVVAMLGDGVNDAPALKIADIGVAVGSGTDVAKEVSDLVILDNNFNTMVKAVEQGRVAYQNIRKVFIFLLADDFSQLFIFFANMVVGLPLPLLAAQILWINLVEDGLPDIALTTEQEIEGIMEDKPRKPGEPILPKPHKIWMITLFFINGLAAFLLFLFSLKFTGNLEKTRSIVFALVAVDSLFLVLVVRSLKKWVFFTKEMFVNKFLVGAVVISFLLLVAAIYLPPLQRPLAVQPLGMTDWLLVFAIASAEVVLIEWFKRKILKNTKF